MAGNYMNAPSDRVAWDRDGSLCTQVDGSNNVTARTATDRRNLNSEDETGINSFTGSILAVVFPVPMDCTSVFFAVSTSPTWIIETSKDTTNGFDGTWDTQYLTGLNAVRNVKPNYRVISELYTLQDNSSSSDLRGIRFRRSGFASVDIRAVHIYGRPSALATADRLAFRNPTTDTPLTPYYFDWGNVPRSSAADRSFRIKNLSEDRVANDIDLYVEAVTPGTPAVDSMHTISLDGGATFLVSQTLDSLAPGELSPVIIVRRTVPANAQISVWSARIAADVNQWEDA